MAKQPNGTGKTAPSRPTVGPKGGTGTPPPIRPFPSGEVDTEKATIAWNALNERQQSTIVEALVDNISSIRRDWMANLTDRRRNIFRECGWPDTISPQNYYDMFERNSIARRVVEMMPRECFQVWPEVYDDEDPAVDTEFKTAWKNLSKQLAPEPSFHSGEQGSGIGDILLRADIMSGVGRFGIIFLGFDDVKEEGGLSQPVTKGAKLQYMRVFPETLCPITKLDDDPASPRYCRPAEYQVTFVDPNSPSVGTDQQRMMVGQTKTVHWSRVIHIAGDTTTNLIYGTPRMQDVFNELLDLRKVRGAGAEGYWLSCFVTTVVSTIPQLGPNAKINVEGLKDMFEQIRNGMQREMILAGLQADTLAPDVVDLTPHWDKGIESICIVKSWPVRIFKGSERGSLASSQDEGDWNDKLRSRQMYYVTPCVIIPLVDRLIGLDVLPAPKNPGYTVYWPDLESQPETEKAAIALQKTQALATYVSGGVEGIMTVLDYLTIVLGMDDDEAQSVVDNVMEAAIAAENADESSGSPLLQMVGGVTGMTELFAQFKAGAMSEDSLKQLIMLFYGLSEQKASDIVADGLPEPLTVTIPATGPMKPRLGTGGMPKPTTTPIVKPATPK